ncbi:hypothetical protein A3G67_04740 [Candidatus Roizmanbacteria bacterium RIFCSPLOWO2_12_FULL_40_12]|uniref:8-oxo-dGTP diphosphatase n=1 Tax=Candidatus Roizmanbacteria bacterium RIFCSPLOWO2_01_FULL_40_42 TaxID=1802066 RepID=A0A1F7J4V3_9BACT|nr:MAG: hypothetical protein A2779_04410 [Candidatus Roizmanbacteria bacterium RIFCSPHIGHO2_01_FULL_40_98]OGK27403.1 MAG: hypothetical protein A3C31_04735 [Candidatus Roizmanbacteria bacterium RIFCSPHIGHO2_02_FULL_40_53]OGK30888.1 MAG: hypothetical protein A2W49_02305 [Candidatus Roizmanbacteria bacterium RIFCSPHIGHO2_12_41_18]OGK36491.1 MAG: hypothetical protein A3E69_02360 [Candidatus Roizmanbacteria bacterium RIFCSPHIGHO2_12_FULL_40_130]OGK50637.1 MAG: hypothetical protein A3B50_02090 [Candi
MDKPKIIYKVGLAHFKDGKILMTRSIGKDVFYCAGGKFEEGESDIACLKREVKEELGVELDDASIKFLKTFEDVAHGKVDMRVNIKMYSANLLSEPKPSQEIEEIRYLDSTAEPKILAPIDIQIFAWLKENNFID